MQTPPCLSDPAQCVRKANARVCIGYMTRASVLKLISNNVSYTLYIYLGGVAQFVKNLLCMQIFVIWVQASLKFQALKAKT